MGILKQKSQGHYWHLEKWIGCKK